MASIDIIEEVRNQTGSKPVPKIDPNTQAPDTGKASAPDPGNAIIPALLVGFYKHSRNADQAAALMNENYSDNMLNTLFGNKKDSVVQSVSNYTGISPNRAEAEMNNIVLIIKDVLKKEISNSDGKSVSAFFTDQRSNILKHLPVELNMGELMEDSSVDDRTNKMEGPMSGMMHTIEKIFSSTK